MRPALVVQITPRARAQLERAAQWWQINRPAAAEAVLDDFEIAKDLLAHQPGVGARCTSARHPDLRRLYLARVRYHLYYRIETGRVVVLAFWHASRGSEPQL